MRFLILTSILTVLLLAPLAVGPFFGLTDSSVQAAGLVPCGGTGEPTCNTCHVVALADNVIGFLVQMLSVLAVIVMVYAGFKMVTSGGDEGAWSEGKKAFTNVVIGIIIVLAAWLIVDTLLKGLTGTGLEFWGSLSC
jgi:hypothetical protein